MKTLIINAHPDYLNDNHFSIKYQEIFLDKFKKKFPDSDYTILNLYDLDLPRIEEKGLQSIWNKRRSSSYLTSTELKIEKNSQALLSQFKEHHRIVIVSPLHNFNITSRLKDYLDNILISRETFKYTSTGSEGLMTNNYKVLLLQASGSIYTNDDSYTPLEFSNFYLKAMFEEIMGFNKFYIARMEGTALLKEDEVIADGITQLEKLFADFYSNI